MDFLKKNYMGIFVCFVIAVPSWLLGKRFPVVGGAVIAIILGMIIALFWNDKGKASDGIKFTSKMILQAAVVLLGFGMNLSVVLQTGKQSLPIIICTISLIGVGSSICGGSAIAATAPVIDADDDEVAQAISVIFFFNVLAALLFPSLGKLIGFDISTGEAFGIFAGTAVNDTSSVTAAASTWDSMWNLGSQTLDKAVTVKLTRTLAIIPITLVLAYLRAREAKKDGSSTNGFSFRRAFPMFIVFFVIASIITTICLRAGVPSYVFKPLKELSKFFIIMAMAAIGLNSNIIKLIKSGGKPILLGGCCWIGITVVCLLMQHVMGIW